MRKIFSRLDAEGLFNSALVLHRYGVLTDVEARRIVLKCLRKGRFVKDKKRKKAKTALSGTITEKTTLKAAILIILRAEIATLDVIPINETNPELLRLAAPDTHLTIKTYLERRVQSILLGSRTSEKD